jgi:hypothetical protein
MKHTCPSLFPVLTIHSDIGGFENSASGLDNKLSGLLSIKRTYNSLVNYSESGLDQEMPEIKERRKI